MNLFYRIKRLFEFKRKNIVAWNPCNIYKTAKIGKNVSIGMFAEIGNNVVIGDNTRIGAGAYIPEGVIIGDNVFIAPHVIFSNDTYPPSPKEQWKYTAVCNGASIGAGANILAGVLIGVNSLVGMGSVVVKDIPDNQIWAGVPATFLRGKT